MCLSFTWIRQVIGMPDDRNKGEVTYEIRADDSFLEQDLDAAEKKVVQKTQEVAETAEQEVKSTSNTVKEQIKSVSDAHKKETSEQVKTEEKAGEEKKGVIKHLKEYAKKAAEETKENVVKKVSGITESVKHPQKAVKAAAEKAVEHVKQAGESITNKVQSSGERIIDTIAHPIKSIKDGAKSVKDKTVEYIEKSVETIKKAADTVSPIASDTAKAIGAAFVTAGTATVAIGTMAVNSANNLDKAANQYIASTGKSVDETERYKKVLESVYSNNYGESFEDIADAMSQVERQLGELSDEQLQQVTESAFALRDVFEYDIAESTRAAKAMMDNFGISGEEAMNLIATGAQNGLDYSGELIDSISEYSVQFAKVGLDADDMFKIFQKGAETGAWNLDKIGDAVKEMAIRVVDGSDTTKQGFKDIGLSADKMSKKFAQGGESAKEAFQQTIEALAAVKDPLKQNAAGVALFGTMWEDLGPEVVTQLADIGDAAYATGEELNSIKEVKYDDLGAMLEGLKRSVEVLLIPLGEHLIPILSELIEDVMPLLEEALPPILDLVMEGIESLLPVVEEILPLLISLFEELMPVFQQILESILPVFLKLLAEILPVLGEMISEILPILIELFSTLLEPLMELISALLPPLLELFDALLPILDVLISLLDPIIELFMGLLDPVVDLIQSAITPLIEIIEELLQLALEPLQEAIYILGNIFAEQLRGMFGSASSIIQDIAKIFRGLIDFITGIFTGDWEKAWQGVVDIFDGIISGISTILKIPINWVIDGINGFLEGLNNIEIPDWVPVVGGKGFNIPLIPRLKKGMDFVPSDYFPAYLDYGERVLTQQENMIYTALGGVEGMQDMNRNINVTAETDLDYERIGQEMAKAVGGMTVNLDGKPVGEVITPYVDTNLGQESDYEKRWG